MSVLENDEEKDSTSLLSEIINEDSTSILHNFLKFSLTFSITHATVDGILIYSTAELGHNLGAVSGGILYFLYSFSSLLYGRIFLMRFGSKYSLLSGLFSLLIYVTTFLFAVILPSIKWYVCIPGAIIGGIGAGILWPAQGSYYSESARRYALSTGTPTQACHNQFAGYFAGLYLGIEGLSKLLVTALFLGIPNGQWKFISFLIYAVFAFGSTLLSTTIRNFTQNCSSIAFENFFMSTFSLNYCPFSSVYELTRHHPFLLLLLPYQVSFGLCSSYMVYVIDGMILPDHNKEGYIGGLGALSILAAALSTIPITFLTQTSSFSYGLSLVLQVGPLLFGLCASVVVFLQATRIASWPVIVPIVLCYGIGRGIWENTNKSVIAIIYQSAEHRDVAFSVIYFSSGIAATFGFLLYRFIPIETIGYIIMIFSVSGMIGNYYCDKYGLNIVEVK